jgi:CRISPR-associated protein Csm4
MIHYRITVTPLGPRETELVSGTVWGQLAWAVRYLDGEAAFAVWLDGQARDPWLVSSRMPEGMLPNPLLAPAPEGPGIADLDEADRLKAYRKAEFIDERVFLKLRDRMGAPALARAVAERLAGPGDGAHALMSAHNRISRSTGRTPEEGGLFFHDIIVDPPERRSQLFMRTSSPCREKIEALFGFIGSNGFGANASTGCGHMKFEIEEEKRLFTGNGNRAVSLSHGTLTPGMGAPRYRQHVHHGKLGGHFASGAFSPFKYPILMVRPGATFTPAGEGPFGELLSGVHHDPELAGIRHHALHLPLLYTEATA